MPKPKSLTILGVRGLRVHERTPVNGGYYVEYFANDPEPLLRHTAVQAMLWEQDRKYTPKAYDVARYQAPKWQDVFDRAMARYEKENKR